VKHRELLQRLQGLTEAASGSHSSAVSFQNEIFKLTTLLHSTRCWQGRCRIWEARAGRWYGIGQLPWACSAGSECVSAAFPGVSLLRHRLGVWVATTVAAFPVSVVGSRDGCQQAKGAVREATALRV